MNKGRNSPGSQGQRKSYEEKDKWCPFAFLFVLVRSGCYNNIPRTWWFINNRRLFLTVLEAGSLRSGCQQGPVRVLFLVQTFLVSSHGRKGSGALWNLFYKSSNPILHPQDLSTYQTPYLLIPTSLVFHEYWGDTNIQIIAIFKQIFKKSLHVEWL